MLLLLLLWVKTIGLGWIGTLSTRLKRPDNTSVLLAMVIDNQPRSEATRKIGKKAQNLTVNESEERNYEPRTLIIGYVFRTGLWE
jgi:hypothetical protein